MLRFCFILQIVDLSFRIPTIISFIRMTVMIIIIISSSIVIIIY